MSDFITAMAPRLAKVSKHFTADPRPNGGSMFRIYRDVRFAKDKRPYKEHAACHFRHALGKDAHAPGFYMHFSPSEVFFGGGLWMPPPDALTKIREGIAAKPAGWKQLLANKSFAKIFRRRARRGARPSATRVRSGTSLHRRHQEEELLRDARGEPEACHVARACRRSLRHLCGVEPPDEVPLWRNRCAVLTRTSTSFRAR